MRLRTATFYCLAKPCSAIIDWVIWLSHLCAQNPPFLEIFVLQEELFITSFEPPSSGDSIGASFATPCHTNIPRYIALADLCISCGHCSCRLWGGCTREVINADGGSSWWKSEFAQTKSWTEVCVKKIKISRPKVDFQDFRFFQQLAFHWLWRVQVVRKTTETVIKTIETNSKTNGWQFHRHQPPHSAPQQPISPRWIPSKSAWLGLHRNTYSLLFAMVDIIMS